MRSKKTSLCKREERFGCTGCARLRRARRSYAEASLNKRGPSDFWRGNANPNLSTARWGATPKTGRAERVVSPTEQITGASDSGWLSRVSYSHGQTGSRRARNEAPDRDPAPEQGLLHRE